MGSKARMTRLRMRLNMILWHPTACSVDSFHEPLVLHGQIEVACPPATVLIPATNDTRARMDRLEQCFRHMRIFDGVTNWNGIRLGNLSPANQKLRLGWALILLARKTGPNLARPNWLARSINFRPG